MKHLKQFNERVNTKQQVYYTQFLDYSNSDQDILRENTNANQNGYADLVTVGEDCNTEDLEKFGLECNYLNDVDRVLLRNGFKLGDDVIIHYKW